MAAYFIGQYVSSQFASTASTAAQTASSLSATGIAVKVILHALAAGVSAFVSGKGWADPDGEMSVQGLIVSALVGGTVSRLSGGKFANGAFYGFMTYILNQATEKDAQEAAKSGQRRASSFDEAVDNGITAGRRIRNSGEGDLVDGRNIGAPIILNEPWFSEDYYSYPSSLEYDGAGAGFSVSTGIGNTLGLGGAVDLSGSAAFIINVAEGNSFNPSGYAWGVGPNNKYYTGPIYVTYESSGDTFLYNVNKYGISSCTVYSGSASSC